MKNTFLTIALMTAFTAFTVTSYAFSSASASTSITCDGGHECDDKCKKGKDGKCDKVTTADAKGNKKAGHSCCAKGSKKSCKGDSKKAKKATKEETK